MEEVAGANLLLLRGTDRTPHAQSDRILKHGLFAMTSQNRLVLLSFS